MLDLPSVAQDIRAEYLRWVDLAGEDDPYAGPDTLGIHDVLKAHFLLADFFYGAGHGFGGLGPRDIELLHSALYRQHITFEGRPKWSSKYEVAATLLYGLIMDHPFHDANKRTAFLSTLYFLFRNGCIPTIDQKKFENFTVEIANGALKRYSRYVTLRRNKESDPEVKFISHFIKTNTRKMDKRHYIVTFNELSKLLSPFNVYLENPNNNFIDVVKREERKGILGKKVVESRLCRIGFPGGTRQVGAKDIKTIREAAGLTHKFGVDSQTFFKGADPLGALIAAYEPALRRLAER